MWTDVAQQLGIKFDKTFDVKHVVQKWQTLLDGYKKALGNNDSTGRGVTKFAWYQSIDELIGSRHDIQFVVTGTQDGVAVHRPDEVDVSVHTEDSEAGESAPASVEKEKAKRLYCKRKVDSDFEDVLKFMRESDERHTESESKLLSSLLSFNARQSYQRVSE